MQNTPREHEIRMVNGRRMMWCDGKWHHVCSRCNGTGVSDRRPDRDCDKCNGSGVA